jgi:hypothetical protein
MRPGPRLGSVQPLTSRRGRKEGRDEQTDHRGNGGTRRAARDAGVAQADDFKVKNLDDGAVPGPPGSLRRAVEEANANVGDDRIVFASKLSGTINLTATAIYPDTADASGDLEIVGPGGEAARGQRG